MRVFVKNLPAGTGVEELLELFSPFGTITSSFVGGTGLCNVEFASEESAKNAIGAWHGAHRHISAYFLSTIH